MELIIGIIPTLLFYGIVYFRVKGRCSRYEYIIKNSISLGVLILSLFLFALLIPVISFLMFFVMLASIYYYIRLTIRRLYDLAMPGFYIFFTLIPIVGIILTIMLFIRKSSIDLNEYDEAINYRKIIKGKHFLNICKNKIYFDDIEFNMEHYLGKYTIKISKYIENNIFSEYLLHNYSSEKENIYELVSIKDSDFLKIIKKLDLVLLYEFQYIKLKEYIMFIRYYNFGYSIIINKEEHKLTKNMIDTFDFPGAYSENDKYIYYNNITKEEIMIWIKNVA